MAGARKRYAETRLPNGKIIRKKQKEDLEKVIIQYYSAPLTFDDLYHHWRKFQDQMVSDNTAYKYDTDYRRYYQDTALSKMDITKITERCKSFYQDYSWKIDLV